MLRDAGLEVILVSSSMEEKVQKLTYRSISDSEVIEMLRQIIEISDPDRQFELLQILAKTEAPRRIMQMLIQEVLSAVPKAVDHVYRESLE